MRASQFVKCTQFIAEVSLTARKVRTPQFRVRIAAYEVCAPQLQLGAQFIGDTCMTAHEVCAPQFRVHMAAYKVNVPQLLAHNSLGVCT